MICLNCHYQEVSAVTENCPQCGVYLPALLRDVLPQGTLLRSKTYQIDYALGRGNFGITYLARHSVLSHRVAIKEFYPQDYITRNHSTGSILIPKTQHTLYQRGLQRFIAEGQMLVRLSHPNVVQVRDLFEERETAYLVMDLIEGTTLSYVLASQNEKILPLPRVERLMEQLVSALTTVHEAEIYHLDLKPDNILITPEDKVILIDFGAAKQAANYSSGQTRFFTESYAAPEIMAGTEIGPESDIFELGMILHEMLTGFLPTPAMTRLVEGDFWKPDTLQDPWRTLVTNALKLKREERPKSVQEWWNSRKSSYKTLRSTQKISGTPLASTLRGQFILADLREKGMQQRLGRGLIKKVFPLTKQLIIVSAAGGTTLFDLHRDEALWEIDCPTECGAISDNKRRLAIVWQETVYIWSLETGMLLQKVSVSTVINCVALNATGELLAVGQNEIIAIWSVASGNLVKQLSGHEWFVTSMAFSLDGQWLVSGSRDRTFGLWAMDSGTLIRRIEGHTQGVETIVISPNSQWIATGSRDHSIAVWELVTGHLWQYLQGHTAWITDLAFSENSQLLASASGIEDKTIAIWKVADGELIQRLQGHWNSVKTIAFCPESEFLVSGSYDYTVRLWDRISGQIFSELEQHTNWLYAIAITPDGHLVAAGYNNCTICIWDTIKGDLIQTFLGHTDAVSSLAFSPDGRFLVSGSWDQTVRLWDMTSGKQLRVYPGHKDFVTSVAFSPDGKLVASGSWDGTVKLWEVARDKWSLAGTKTMKIIKGHTDEVESVAFSPDGLLVASASNDQTVRFWEVASGQEVYCLEGHHSNIECIAFNAKGEWLVTGGRDQILRLWEINSGKQLQVFMGHTGSIKSVAISPDNKWLISGSQDKTIRLWDLSSGHLLHLWSGHTNSVNSVVLSPDGTRIISGDNDGVIRIWRI